MRLIKRGSSWSKTQYLEITAIILLCTVFMLGTGLRNLISTQLSLPINPLKYLWYMLYLGAAVHLFFNTKRPSLGYIAGKNRLLIIVVALAVLSILWTLDPNSTLKRSFHLIGTLFLAMSIGLWFPLNRLVTLCFSLFLISLLANLIAIYLAPQLTIADHKGDLVWQGLTGHKNTLGALCSIGATVSLLYSILHNRWQNILIGFLGFLLCFYMLLQTESATALICLIACVLYLAVMLGGNLYKNWFAFSIVMLPIMFSILVTLLMLGDINIGSFAALLDKNDTLTGRTPIWVESWELNKQRPFLGYGFGTIWYQNNDTAIDIHYELLKLRYGDEPIVHAHNGFLTLSNQIGIPAGIASVALLMISFTSKFFSFLRSNSSHHLVLGTLALYVIIYNITEDCLFRPQNIIWLLYLIFLVNQHSTIKQKKRKKRKRKSRRRTQSRGTNSKSIADTIYG